VRIFPVKIDPLGVASSPTNSTRGALFPVL
jgi:hypothetical protein